MYVLTIMCFKLIIQGVAREVLNDFTANIPVYLELNEKVLPSEESP